MIALLEKRCGSSRGPCRPWQFGPQNCSHNICGNFFPSFAQIDFDGSWVIVVSGGVSCCVLLRAGIFKLGFRLGCATKDWPLMQINDSRINT